MAEKMLMYPRPQAQESWSSHQTETREQHFGSPPPSSFAHDSQLTCSPVTSSSYYQGPGFIRVPCKARGVSNDHNAQNAYIDIPRDAAHGLILQCSNAICANSGRRFRYCSVCQTPAAKRNFHVRHAHGMNTRKGVRDDSLGGPPRAPTPPFEKRRRSSRKVNGSTEEIAAMANQAIRELTIEDQPAEEEIREPPKKIVKSVCHPEEQHELSAEEIEWLSLLRTRPNFENNEETTAWLSSVIECSLAAEPAEPPQEVGTLHTQIGADDADEILSALGCSDEEKFDEDGDGEFHFDFDEA